MNKRRLLLVSCSIILLCMLSIVGMTFALFTSSVGVRNHLVAGSLDVTLHRTDLAYTVLDSATGKLITVTDPRLIEKTGGIVQGMSGSPIIQDGKLVGAVTHVLINDPTTGYGIFVENMLDAAA